MGGQPTVTGEHASQERASAVEIASVPSTIVDALEEDLEASAVSTVPASSRAVRHLVLVGGHAHHEPTSPEVRGPDAAVPVINIPDPDSEVLLDTATDPDLSRDGVANVEMGGD